MSGATATWTRSWCGGGKDEQDWSDLVVQAPPLYIQEKVHPKVLIDDLMKSEQWRVKSGEQGTGGLSTHHSPLSTQLDLFADFNGCPTRPAPPTSTSTTPTGPTA